MFFTRSESIRTNGSFKVAFSIARTMNFDCSIFPECRLWIENSASFYDLSSAWIPGDTNAAIAACFVFAINPFIVTHIHPLHHPSSTASVSKGRYY